MAITGGNLLCFGEDPLAKIRSIDFSQPDPMECETVGGGKVTVSRQIDGMAFATLRFVLIDHPVGADEIERAGYMNLEQSVFAVEMMRTKTGVRLSRIEAMFQPIFVAH